MYQTSFSQTERSFQMSRAFENLRIACFAFGIMVIAGCSADFSVEPSDDRQVRFATGARPDSSESYVTVTLPEDYRAANDAAYALLLHFAFDEESYDWTREVVDQLNAREGEHDIILASLDYVDGSVAVDDGQAPKHADNTLVYIEEALLPLLREKYRIEGGVILTGWSRFGRFATYALGRKPELFDGVIISSSAPDDSPLHENVRAALEGNTQLDVFVYHAIGTEGNEADRRPAFDRLTQMMESAATSNVRLKSEVIDGADHVGTFKRGLRSGLASYFEGAEQVGEISIPQTP